ncbi:hypothetical protein U1Q18_034966 [Sarracenia purpurea var. burkii]
MSTTIEQPPPPPLIEVIEQGYRDRSVHGPVGPVIAVLALITILGAIAVMIGRLCTGRRIMGHVQYDFEGWMEAKCASCIDGRVAPPPPPPRAGGQSRSSGSGTTGVGGGVSVVAPPEPNEEETSTQHDTHGSA